MLRILLIILVILVVYTAYVYGRLRYVLYKSNLPPIVQEDKILGLGTPLRYLAVGDSTAVGIGASSAEKTYSYQIAEHLASKHQVIYKNIGVKGFITEDVTGQLDKIIAFNPDVVTVSIGGNDLTHWVSKSTILTNYELIISKLLEKTHSKIYITGIPNFLGAELLPNFYRKILDRRALNINASLFNDKTERVRWVNIHDYGWHEYSDLKLTFAADQFHPSDLGYQNWTNAFLEQIRKDYE